jgi:hypothetical protein
MLFVILNITSILDEIFPDRLPELSLGGDNDVSDPYVDDLKLASPDLDNTGETCLDDPALLEPLCDFKILSSNPTMTLGESREGGLPATMGVL